MKVRVWVDNHVERDPEMSGWGNQSGELCGDSEDWKKAGRRGEFTETTVLTGTMSRECWLALRWGSERKEQKYYWEAQENKQHLDKLTKLRETERKKSTQNNLGVSTESSGLLQSVLMSRLGTSEEVIKVQERSDT